MTFELRVTFDGLGALALGADGADPRPGAVESADILYAETRPLKSGPAPEGGDEGEGDDDGHGHGHGHGHGDESALHVARLAVPLYALQGKLEDVTVHVDPTGVQFAEILLADSVVELVTPESDQGFRSVRLVWDDHQAAGGQGSLEHVVSLHDVGGERISFAPGAELPEGASSRVVLPGGCLGAGRLALNDDGRPELFEVGGEKQYAAEGLVFTAMVEALGLRIAGPGGIREVELSDEEEVPLAFSYLPVRSAVGEPQDERELGHIRFFQPLVRQYTSNAQELEIPKATGSGLTIQGGWCPSARAFVG